VINKTIAARDAATKQSTTYHKLADDLYKQAKQIVDAAKPVRDCPLNPTLLTDDVAIPPNAPTMSLASA